jgi:relaxase MobL-like protein
VSERCIVRVKFTPAGAGAEVRRAVGGFLRYVQHRDLHPDSEPTRRSAEVAGLLKYVAYRDKASARAELFGAQGPLGTRQRKEFADFVARSIEGSEPQLFQARDGRSMDRRRAVSRFVISPERAAGLDLEALTHAAIRRLEAEMGMRDLRWIAAIHRNTRHHHVHLVLAGMHEVASGVYRRVDVSKPRLAAMKQTVGLEIERQRRERAPSKTITPRVASGIWGRDSIQLAALKPPVARPALIRPLPLAPLAGYRAALSGARRHHRPSAPGGSILALRTAARRYQRRMQYELEAEARRLGWEHAA